MISESEQNKIFIFILYYAFEKSFDQSLIVFSGLLDC